MSAIFDAIADRITQGTAAIPTTGTLLLWLKPNWAETDGNDHVFFHVTDGASNFFVMQKFSDNNLYCGWKGASDTRVVVTSASYDITTTTWQNIILRWTAGAGSELFLEGTSIGTAGAPSTFTTTSNRTIGNYVSVNVGLNGNLAHYAVWGRALTNPQIAALQTKTPDHPDVGPIGTDWITLFNGSTANVWGGTIATLTSISGSSDMPKLESADGSSRRNRSRAFRGR
jgi:hypothetical protein